MLNTTLHEQVFNVPEEFLGVLPDDFPTQITIFKSLPSLDGTREAEPGRRRRDLRRGADRGLDHALRRDHAERLRQLPGERRSDGVAIVRIAGAVSTNIQYLGSLSGSIDLAFFTDRDGNTANGSTPASSAA